MQCTHGVTSVGGVTAGQARLNSSNVRVSLRAIWDTGQVGHISSGVKQVCILAPTLFAIFAAAMFMHAFSDLHSVVSIRFRSNGWLFNLARLRSQSKCVTTLLREFQYADDCALMADSGQALQDYIGSFADAASSFCLTRKQRS